MQFLGQLRVADPDRLALVFQCETDPGQCDDWDEVPACPDCGRPMGFVAQLEEGPSRMNFGGGGGAAYVFRCAGCDAGAFLWQR